MPEMEPWLRQQLLTKTGGFRAARFAVCTNCGAWTLTGLDDDTCAVQATTDPTPINPAQEVECALNFRRTYTLGRTPGGKPAIQHRDPYAIGRPTHQDVVPAHRCGHRYPGRPRPRTTADTDQCPF